MLRHTFHKEDIALFTGIIGVGADISVSSQLMSFATYSQNTLPKNDGGRIELTEKRKVNPFINLGLAFSYSLSNNHKLEASLMFNFYPLMNNYKYEYKNPNGYNGVYNDNSKSFDNHSLSVSIAYYL
ncbi:MAG: hypothetical protein IJ759_06355 [Bacteroidales bacterium]|nr:hypothetical protein [Bacteroidales bacterium]